MSGDSHSSEAHACIQNGEVGGTAGNLGFPIHWWQGKSGKVYPHSVFPLAQVPWLPEANFVLVSIAPDGTHEPIYVGATENLAETLRTSSVIPQALRLGATHIHIHLLGGSPQRRLEIRQDVREASRMALNPDQAWLAAS